MLWCRNQTYPELQVTKVLRLTNLRVGLKSSSIASKGSTVPSKASTTIATDASITIAVRYRELGIAVTIAIGGEMSIGVTVRESMSLGNTHNTKTPELVYKRNRDHTGRSQCLQTGD